MSEVGDAIDEVRVDLAAESSEFMPDLCDLIAPVKSEQGAGHTIADSVIATDIPCTVEQVGGGGVQFHDGESVVTKSDRIELPYNATTVLINRKYKVRVHARGVNPQMIFEQPVIRTDSMSPLLQVFAVLTEGYRTPGII